MLQSLDDAIAATSQASLGRPSHLADSLTQRARQAVASHEFVTAVEIFLDLSAGSMKIENDQARLPVFLLFVWVLPLQSVRFAA